MTKTRDVLAFVTVAVTVVLVGGCQKEQGQSSEDVRIHRLIALENKELKAQLAAETQKRDAEIKNLREQLQTETKKRDNDIQGLMDRLAQCEWDRTEGIKASEKKMQEQIDNIMSPLMLKNQELSAEVEKLQKELAALKGQGGTE
jgi:hypothetical protein